MSTGCPSGGSEFSSQHAQGQLVTTRNSSSGETLLNLAYIHTYITLNGGGGGGRFNMHRIIKCPYISVT